jgi:hypothetical protein
MRWREYKYWSIVHGRTVARISTFDPRGGELWVWVDATDGKVNGKTYRERRENALDMLHEALALGLEPGEVRLVDAA